MKITIVCDVLGKENNGTTIAAMNLIRSLKEKGHEVKVVCNDKDKQNLEGYYVVPRFYNSSKQFITPATLIATNQIKLDEEKIMIRLVKIYKNLVK